ncbi:MAG TPA: hypothetical protein IGS52_21975 [Oscillatoriaceae cyanobacterium M33_DOE_052]|uniref:Uncharacterized protein n=1 Tax=Planktothricoides sp. SpSt-374 TaxID=2282167 RepID=A0A7C3ZJ52_9CYAN|nr:hypothetical protein [Oscillatoriaceae cyanobacterium M33_DOE_052]
MDPLSMLLWAAVWAGVAAGIYVTVYFVDLTLEIIASWFRRFAHLIVQNDRRAIGDRDYLAFTVKQAINTGNYKIAQGIFNTRTEEIYDARAIEAGSLDSKIQSEHRFKEVVIW